jgi:hypothetical protein
MRSSNIKLTLVAVAVFAAVSLPARALEIKFCSPTCEGPDADPSPTVIGPGTPVTDPVTGVTTNSIAIPTFTTQGATKAFTITATVTSQQSGSLQKIVFNPTAINATSASACSVTEPCRLEIVATSNQFDFPTPKPVGGYPAGAFMMGSFAGPQAVSPNGDTISATSEASGIRLVTDDSGAVTIQAITTDVVNSTPGAGPANVGTSLPSACTGTPGCKFVASALRRAFSTQISETVQQQCDVEQASCLTRLRTRLNIEIKTPGNRVTLPFDWVTVNNSAEHPEINPTELLVASTLASVGTFEVDSLGIGPNHFLLKATLNVGANVSIDPAAEEVYARVGPFSLTILPGQFKQLQQGNVFTFNGKVDERQVNATLARDRKNPSLWEVILAVYGVHMIDAPRPPLQVPVEIGIGGDAGRDLVTARFFGDPAR